MQPLKSETHRVRVKIGGDILTHDGNTTTTREILKTVKVRANITISTPDSSHLKLDVKDYFY